MPVTQVVRGTPGSRVVLCAIFRQVSQSCVPAGFRNKIHQGFEKSIAPLPPSFLADRYCGKLDDACIDEEAEEGVLLGRLETAVTLIDCCV